MLAYFRTSSFYCIFTEIIGWDEHLRSEQGNGGTAAWSNAAGWERTIETSHPATSSSQESGEQETMVSEIPFTMSPRRWHPAIVLLLIASALLLASSPTQAKVDSIRASASPDHLELGDSFIYQVTIEGSGTLPTPSSNIPTTITHTNTT